MIRLDHRARLIIAVAAHVPLVVVSNYLAFLLRFDGAIPAEEATLFFLVLPGLVATRMAAFSVFKVHERLWRYTSVSDLTNIIAAVAVSSAVVYLTAHWGFGLFAYPRSVILIDAVLLIFIVGGLRLTRRLYRELRHADGGKRVLIYGAGDAGEMIIRDMRHNGFYGYEPIGFFDDDQNKVGRRIHGVKVLGTRQDIPRVMVETEPDAVVIAMPRAEAVTIRAIVRALEPFKVPIQTLPNLRDVLDGKVTVSQIRTLAVEDLLERSPVGLDIGPLRHLIQDRRVLITGAGGSIGSELARQVCALGPSTLLLLDRYENGLHAVAMELASRDGCDRVDAVIGDVTDLMRMNHVMANHRPQLVFHAAAHKHVPLMELNPCEAVKNNVRGTRIMAQVARVNGVERFVLISTDKAVNPSSVMGATKRVAELVIQAMNGGPTPVFATVRFGNVLASNGSVVPYFLEQIKAGGPVTVTHPEIRRYFMSIPEAVHLVLQAAALAAGGEIFVLDMGEQIKVLDLARNLIRLSGFVPEDEIAIRFVGLRPGEKLYEELIGRDETARPSAAERILRVDPKFAPHSAVLASQIRRLERAADDGDVAAVGKQLGELVPTYRPEGGNG